MKKREYIVYQYPDYLCNSVLAEAESFEEAFAKAYDEFFYDPEHKYHTIIIPVMDDKPGRAYCVVVIPDFINDVNDLKTREFEKEFTFYIRDITDDKSYW